MIVVCSDTHAEEGHRCTDELLRAIRKADLVVHAGDFTTEAALAAFREEAARLAAVRGNADSPAVRDRLPATSVVEAGGVRIAATHRHDAGATGLAMLGRSRDADLVVFGHTHRPTVVEAEGVTLLNPGSHAEPRGNRPGYAELWTTDRGFEGELRTPDGTSVESFAAGSDR